MGVLMPTTNLLSELKSIERIREQELEEARSVQRLMLPDRALQTGPIFVSHELQPEAAVGGDFLDYFELSDNTIGLYLGDVAGKGLPAALYAGLAVGTMRGVHKTGTLPHDVLGTLNRRLMIRGMPRLYAAVQYAVFDPRSRQLQIASAGMPHPLHISSNCCRVVDVSGIPSGLFPRTTYDTVTLELNPGDSVLFYTDGLTDACDRDDKHFGAERLQEFCNGLLPESPTEILSKIFEAMETFVRGHEQYDDMAAVIFHYS
jgi:sigma-B regulation protein RsbU (phosphoserine phosphatase)